MKLKRFDPETAPPSRDGLPRVNMGKSGVWRANAPACALLNLKKGARVVLLQDDDDATNWYIATDKANGFEVYEKDGSCFWCTQSVKLELLKSLDSEHPGGTMLLGTEPTKHDGLLLYPLITSSLVYRPRRSKS